VGAPPASQPKLASYKTKNGPVPYLKKLGGEL